MANYRGPSRDKRVPVTLGVFQQWVQEFLIENNYITRAEIPENVSAFINDAGYITRITNAPVNSVNGQTGDIVLSLFSGKYSDLIGKPTLFSGAYNDLSGKPLLFSGNYDDLSNKPTTPIVRRSETYRGLTNASGNYSVTYSTPFPSVPDVQPQLQAGTPTQVVRVVSNTTTGFTVQVTNRTSANLLGLELLLAATTVVSGSDVSVLVTAR